ncbi:MAG: tetratricopeptide repeat protein, partial [Candidatus Acidiferrum sp.]
MAADVSKHLDRAKRFLEKNRVEDAIEAYLAVLDGAPQHQEATQALGDLYARMEQPDRAAVYYGLLFDLLIDPRDETKALAIYNRFLRSGSVAQPPERIARYAFLQQKQNHPEEATDQYTKAAEIFTGMARQEDALFCWERIAQLDPENLNRQLRLAEAAEQIGKNALAARTFLRAGQLASAGGADVDALKLLGRAYKLAPQERSVALLYAQAKLRSDEAAEAATLLEPFAATESDTVFLETYGDALIRGGNLDRAREVLEKVLREKNAGAERLFELADAYASSAETTKGVDVLQTLKRRMFADKRQSDFAAQLDAVAIKHPHSQGMMEFWASVYNELNRETQYFEILVKLFDVYFNAGDFRKACDALERLVDIDAYDYRNQERMDKLRGHVDEAFLKRVGGRLAKGMGTAPPPPSNTGSATGVAAAQPNTEEGRNAQALEDLIVQTEIFLQYSLQSKALERLQKIAAMFPGEEERNARLQNLYQTANWWPPGAAKAKQTPAAAPVAPSAPVVEAQPVMPSTPTTRTGVYSAETLRDLSKISEINQKIFRQQTPRAMLNTAVSEVGSHLRTARCIAVVGAPGRPPEMSAEFCGQTSKPTPGAQIVLLLSEMEKAEPDELGGLVVDATGKSILSEMGLATALGVMITDKETQAPAGMLIVGQAEPHKWRPNEAYFLQAIGDQMLMSVSHTR